MNVVGKALRQVLFGEGIATQTVELRPAGNDWPYLVALNKISHDLARANQLRQQMTADIAHDLRTPLSVFAGYTEAVEVNGVVADCLLLTKHTLGKRAIKLVTALRASGTIEINRSELQQVLINLIVNAVQAMPDGGTLTLSSDDREEDDERAGAVIRVRDTGQGIPSEHLSRIFDPFFTTKKGSGTGLGLSISYTIVERYGGRITVVSHPGEGAEFCLWLRRAAAYDESPSAPDFMRRWNSAP